MMFGLSLQRQGLRMGDRSVEWRTRRILWLGRRFIPFGPWRYASAEYLTYAIAEYAA